MAFCIPNLNQTTGLGAVIKPIRTANPQCLHSSKLTHYPRVPSVPATINPLSFNGFPLLNLNMDFVVGSKIETQTASLLNGTDSNLQSPSSIWRHAHFTNAIPNQTVHQVSWAVFFFEGIAQLANLATNIQVVHKIPVLGLVHNPKSPES